MARILRFTFTYKKRGVEKKSFEKHDFECKVFSKKHDFE